ncbi:hypothetical protein AGMMS50239_41450 [Bacteroidia bacterium]|nr:hypothetical protein AGMMS50239_41450 [Bacteroidia bacterium]
MLKKTFLIILSLFVIIACNKVKTLDNVFEGVQIVVNPDKAIPQIQASSMFSNIEYVPLETSEEHLIGEIAQILFYKDRFYILDNEISKSVFCFQKDGKFLFKINRKGNGPGEYIDIKSISINHDQDQLLLYCGATHQIITFDLDCNYIESHRLDFYASFFSYIGDGFSAFSCNYNTSNHTCPIFWLKKSNNLFN